MPGALAFSRSPSREDHFHVKTVGNAFYAVSPDGEQAMPFCNGPWTFRRSGWTLAMSRHRPLIA